MLLEHLHSDGTQYRAHAARRLGELKHEPAVGPLTDALLDTDQQVRLAAIEALGQIGTSQVIDPLCRALQSKLWTERRAAARALGTVGDAACAQPLIAMLADENAGAADAAAQSLIAIGKPAVEPLIAVVRSTTAETEAWLPLEDPPDDPEEPAEAKPNDKKKQPQKGETKEAAVVEAAEPKPADPETARRRSVVENLERAVYALGEIGDARAVDVVRPLLILPYTTLNITADERATEHLLPLLTKKVPEDRDEAKRVGKSIEPARAAAVRALGQIGDRRAVRPIARLIEGDELSRGVPYVEVGEALGRLGDPAALDALVKFTPKIRHGAAWAIGETRDPNLAENLLPLIQDEHAEVRAAAAWSLGQLEYEAAIDALVGLLDDAETKPRRSAANALGTFKDERAVAALVAAWDDPEPQVRTEVLLAVMRTESPEARDVLRKSLEDENADVRALAEKIINDVARDLGVR